MKNPRKVAAVIDGLSGSWESPLLAALDEGPLRSGELRRRLSGRLDYRVFQDTATRLTDRGLISRTDHGSAGVSYELTTDGRSVLDMLEGIETWIDTHPHTAARVPRAPRTEEQTASASEQPAGSEQAGADAGSGADPG